jgi:predicted lipoprotein with Yx(FWY)xxD motif
MGTGAGSGYAYVPGNLLLGLGATTTGQYLIADNGMTLYTYANDTTDTSNCTSQCAVTWPPYTIDSADELANLQAGIGGKAGFITRADGSMQVTYNGMPVYFYTGDQASGDTNGQGVGGQWSIVTP